MKAILDGLLMELGQIYEKSDIRKICAKESHEWHYSLITTPMVSGGPLILGFNWGASQGKEYNPETSVNRGDFSKEDVGSLSRIFPYCEKYYGDDFLSKTSQSNYCFFRSERENQISSKDIELCEPIFKKLIDVIAPSSILCFSSKLRDHLLRNNSLNSIYSKEIKFKRGSSDVAYKAIKANLLSGTEIKFLPHPNYPMKKAARSEAWEFCCGKS